MCFLALLYRTVPEYPIVLGANRDEFRDRPGIPPHAIAPGIVAGTDPRAGGTWLGVAGGRLVAAITNLVPPTTQHAHARSRGQLCADALHLGAASELSAFLHAQTEGAVFNEFNLVVADPESAWTATWVGGELTVRALAPGVHVIGNSTLDREDDPKVQRGRVLIGRPRDPASAERALRIACRDRGERPDRSDAVCVSGERHGTLSSTILLLHATDPSRHRYLFADGSPCEVEYADLSHLLRSP